MFSLDASGYQIYQRAHIHTSHDALFHLNSRDVSKERLWTLGMIHGFMIHCSTLDSNCKGTTIEQLQST